MTNQEAAAIFANAIRQFANKEANIFNLECYLSVHFDNWLERFANSPEDMAAEMKYFAEMTI